jgi:predicted transcriptional regulator
MLWDAIERQQQADADVADALAAVKDVAGIGIAYAVKQLASEPRIVCAACNSDFMASDTGRELCVSCVREQRINNEWSNQ